MITLLPLPGDATPAVRALGWEWAIEDACQNYVAREAVQFSESEAETLLQAADTLYDMLVQAIPDPITDEFLRQLAIPISLWAAVRPPEVAPRLAAALAGSRGGFGRSGGFGG